MNIQQIFFPKNFILLRIRVIICRLWVGGGEGKGSDWFLTDWFLTNNHLAVEGLGTRLPLGFLSSLKLGSHLFYR